MAKSKKSRRARRQKAAKQTQPVVETPPTEEAEPEAEESQAPEIPPAVERLPVNYAQDYFYVYTELRNIFIVAVLMFAVMAGLTYFI